MIDTHSHINFDEYKENFEEFIINLKNKEIEKVIIPGVEPSTFNEIINLCEKYEMLYGAIGIHPSEFQSYNDKAKEEIKKLLQHNKIVALGEIGLDYHYGADTKEEQKIVFRKQLEIAQETQVPVIIHDREAHEDAYNIISEYKLKDVIFHCFSGTKEYAKKCIDKGYYIAIGGVVTFKNAKDLKETAKTIPLDRILLETDAPYLTPVPYRGKINSPEYLIYIAKEIAMLKNIDPEEVKEQTTINARKIFNF